MNTPDGRESNNVRTSTHVPIAYLPIEPWMSYPTFNIIINNQYPLILECGSFVSYGFSNDSNVVQFGCVVQTISGSNQLHHLLSINVFKKLEDYGLTYNPINN